MAADEQVVRDYYARVALTTSPGIDPPSGHWRLASGTERLISKVEPAYRTVVRVNPATPSAGFRLYLQFFAQDSCCQPRTTGLRLCRRRPLPGLMARTTRKSAVSTSTMLAPLATSNQ
jgi:hypothetical protein